MGERGRDGRRVEEEEEREEESEEKRRDVNKSGVCFYETVANSDESSISSNVQD